MDTPDIDPEIAAERQRQLAAMSSAGGGSLEDHPVEDYFAAGGVHEVVLPNGQSISHKSLTEGDLRKYRALTSRDVNVDRTSKSMRFKMAAGEDRHELLKIAICAFNLLRDGKPVAYSDKTLKDVLDTFPPHILDLVEKDIRAKNPSLRTEATIEELETAITDLQTELEEKRAEEAGKAST